MLENKALLARARFIFKRLRSAGLIQRERSVTMIVAMLVGMGLSCTAFGKTADDAQDNCGKLPLRALKFDDPSVRLESAHFRAAGTFDIPSPQGSASRVQLPAHCEVFAVMQERTGLNGRKFAIRFHMRLPVAWNQRFFFQGGGGSNGNVGDAVGQVGRGLTPALAQGYAVLSQDSGHDNEINDDPAFNGRLSFGFDPESRSNYGHRSLKATAQAGKQMLFHFYGERPRLSFFVGCSKGGQEGMMFAQRYPEEFDGIIATAPGFSLPRAALAQAWDVQVFGSLVKQPGAAGFDVARLHGAFSSADLDIVRTAILKACDADDGLADGIVGDFLRCTDQKVVTELRARACKGDKASDCLSPAQIDAMIRSHEGPRDARGQRLYSDWVWPAGVSADDWRKWKLGTEKTPAMNVILGASLASVFTTPPTVLGTSPQALADFLYGFDFDRDASRIYAVGAGFRQSAWQDVGARSSDLSAFQRRGGRMIVPHGDSDPVFSINDTLNWYREVDQVAKGGAAQFVRVFPVPGMCHCGGGVSTDNYDAFGALVRWVESGAAPDQLIATAGAASPWPGRERPLCAFPKVARFSKRGDPEKAASFSCEL